tara:strand:- start:4283 stop:4777 length:495 start_codon:yes stop_codon:yes gene_type:complete
MKKFTKLISAFILLFFISNCAGYEPIFKSSNLKFVINNHKIIGDKKIGKQIFSKLKRISDNNKGDMEVTAISLTIEVNKTKSATTKNSAGKILEYKIDLNTKVLLKEYLSTDIILNQNFDLSSSYKVQDQFSETVKIEEKVIQNMTEKTYEDLLIKMSENMLTQ